MPRVPRQRSSSGIYHIMLRGANRQEIFHDTQDNARFLETLKKYKIESEIKVYGWCLMGNHVHLLLQEGKEDLAVTMKRIGVSYVSFYNLKYKTTGHLFQDRYRSENVENDSQLLAVVRYIHQNPVRAGIVNKPEEWKWSSCQGYYNQSAYPSLLLDSDFILKMFAEDNKAAVEEFSRFNELMTEDTCLDEKIELRMTDEEAREKINKALTGLNLANIKSLPKQQRDEIIREIKNIDGLTQRQISRITGVSLSLISRA